jgi:hypothetical protein
MSMLWAKCVLVFIAARSRAFQNQEPPALVLV